MDSYNNSFENKLNSVLEDYKKLEELTKKYYSGSYNRKEISNEIKKLSTTINSSLELLKIDIFSNNKKFDHSEYISDYRKALNILLTLSNNIDNKYELIKYFIRENKKDTNHDIVWIISEKSILEELDNYDIIDCKVFRDKLNNIVNNGKSVVGFSLSGLNYKLFPYEFPKKEIKMDIFKLNGLLSELKCLTYNDELGNSVQKLRKYVDNYGGDIDNIPLEIIIENINNLDKEKVLKK